MDFFKSLFGMFRKDSSKEGKLDKEDGYGQGF